MNFQRTTALFSYSTVTKLFSFLFLTLGCLGTKSLRSKKITNQQIITAAGCGLLLFFFNDPLRHLPWGTASCAILYILTLSAGYLCLLAAGIWLGRSFKGNTVEDPFNDENESFEQESKLLYNEYSVNLPTKYYYKGTWRDG